jgi:hypothetical protein
MRPKESNMSSLALAIEIAEVVADARERNQVLDVEEATDRLSDRHPEAGHSGSDIREVLIEETDAPA